MTVASKKKQVAEKKRKECGFQEIPHWDDPEIGYKALLKCIKNYVSYKDEEFRRLAPIISKDEFIWDTFSNMCRRDGYPQYSAEKNKGNFYSFVQTCCIRNQADWARKRNTKAKQLAELQGIHISPDSKEHPEYEPIISLDNLIEDSDDAPLHERITTGHWQDVSDEFLMEDMTKDVSEEKISDKFKISWKEFARLLMEGWSVVDISKKLEVNPTTTRKYHSQLKEKMLQLPNIQELLKATGLKLTKKDK